MDAVQVQKIIDEYLSKITGFAYLKSGNSFDTDELTQEIVFELIKSLGREGREISNLSAYIYRISNNVYYKRIKQNKRISYVELTGSEYEEDNSIDNTLSQEETAILRREISFLSAAYRDIIIQYYFDNRSVSDIAKSKGVAEGTVKWWLFEARKKLKEGFDIVRPNGEKSFNPGNLQVGITGDLDKSPWYLVHGNLIAQNILLAAYKQPLSGEEIAQELGVALPYVENEIHKLTEGELLKRTNDKYQTDFIISNSEISIKNQMILEEGLNEVKERVLEFIDNEWEFFSSRRVNVAGFDRKRILWTAIHLIMDLVRRTTFHKFAQTISIPKRPQGGSWIALGMELNKKIDIPEEYRQERYSYNGPICSYFNDGAYGERILYHFYSDNNHTDNHTDFDRDVLEESNARHNQIILLCIRAANEKLHMDMLSETDKLYAADAIKYGLINKGDDILKPNFIFVPREELNAFQDKCALLGEELLPTFKKMMDKIISNIKASTPKHLWNQAGNFSGADFGCLCPMLLDDLYNAGELSEPQEYDKHILSYYIWA